MSYQKYVQMQKEEYERERPSEDIVGNYAWNERFPYETYLLYRGGDIRFPIFEDTHDKIALDFACGPGRMIPRMSKFFARVDGVDISSRLIAEARAAHPDSNFWVTDGDNLGSVPDGAYDFVYSTIALQHIAVHAIRMKILEDVRRSLKPGGFFTLQFAFNYRFPMSRFVSEGMDGKYYKILLEEDTRHARWNEDRIDAQGTNSLCDVGVGRSDIPDMRRDFEKYFRDISFWFNDFTHVGRVPENVGGIQGYWATHMVFVSGVK